MREILNITKIESENVISLKDLVFVENEEKSKNIVMVFKYMNHDLFGIARRGKKWNINEVRSLMV